MKSLAKMFLCCLSVIGMTALVSSCTEEKPDEPGVDFTGSSILVPNETGTFSVTMEFDAPWEVSNKTAWFSVTPLSGNAGTATINVNVLETNPNLREKVASFIINCGGVNTQYYVIQDVTPGFNIPNKLADLDVTEQTYTFTVEGNVKYEAVSEASWIKINSITYDSTKLDDDVTYSKYMTSHIEMSVEANTGDVRSANIALNGVDNVTGEAVNETITIRQFGEVTVDDWNAAFFRRTFMIKHTATFCGPCYYLSENLHTLEGMRPGRMLYASFYQASNVGMSLPWAGAYDYMADTRNNTLPTAVINNYGWFTGSYDANTMANMVDEATEKLPASTQIAGQVALNNGTLEANLSIAAKEAGAYHVSVFVLEDGIVHYQVGGGSNYVHNNLTLGEITPKYGQEVQLEAQKVNKVQISGALPTINIDGEAHTSDPANLHVLVVVYKSGSFTSSLGLTPMNLGSYVDNVVNIPVNGFTLLEYEN